MATSPVVPMALRKAAMRTVRAACRLASAAQASISAVDKADASPVTKADFGVQCLITSMLEEELTGRSEPFRLVAEEEPDWLESAGRAAILDEVVDLVSAFDPRVPAADGSGGEGAGAGAESGAGAGAWTRDKVVTELRKGGYAGGPDHPFWVLDPIDGTKGFIRGDQYAVGLAYVVGGVPVLGVLGCPNLPASYADESSARGCLIVAVAGGDCVLYPLTGDSADDDADTGGVVVKASSETDTTKIRMCESFEKGHSSHSTSARVCERLGVTKEPLRLDSMCKYGLVGRGEVGLYLRFPRAGYSEKIWDHAPGVVVVQSAGGTVTDARGKPLDFSQGRMLSNNVGVVVSSGSDVHSAAISAVAEVLDSPPSGL